MKCLLYDSRNWYFHAQCVDVNVEHWKSTDLKQLDLFEKESAHSLTDCHVELKLKRMRRKKHTHCDYMT